MKLCAPLMCVPGEINLQHVFVHILRYYTQFYEPFCKSHAFTMKMLMCIPQGGGGGGVLEVYMAGGPTELHINTKAW